MDAQLFGRFLDGPDIGVSELTDAQVLGVLGELGVRFAQGPVIGVPATAAETYDLHLTAR